MTVASQFLRPGGVAEDLDFGISYSGFMPERDADVVYAEVRRSTALAWPNERAECDHELRLWLQRRANDREVAFDWTRCWQTVTSIADGIWYFVCDTFTDPRAIRWPHLSYTRVRDHLAHDCGARYLTACQVAFYATARREGDAGVQRGWL